MHHLLHTATERASRNEDILELHSSACVPAPSGSQRPRYRAEEIEQSHAARDDTCAIVVAPLCNLEIWKFLSRIVEEMKGNFEKFFFFFLDSTIQFEFERLLFLKFSPSLEPVRSSLGSISHAANYTARFPLKIIEPEARRVLTNSTLNHPSRPSGHPVYIYIYI